LVLGGQWTTADLFERKVPIVKTRQLIVVPTTCGTGSEATSITIVELTQKKTKLGLNTRELYPDIAALIPSMLQTLPYKFFATSSIDALIHAIESYVSPKANPFTELFGEKAIELIVKSYQRIKREGQATWIEDAETLLLASNYAGISFNNAGCAAVHALSYPLGSQYHIAHGEANHLMFTAVFKAYQTKKPIGKITKLQDILARLLDCKATDVWNELETLLDAILHKKALRDYGIAEDELPTIAAGVIEKQQRLLANNYADLTVEEMICIYQSLY
jgi:4-hydroxybutyrate dehydrogenase